MKIINVKSLEKNCLLLELEPNKEYNVDLNKEFPNHKNVGYLSRLTNNDVKPLVENLTGSFPDRTRKVTMYRHYTHNCKNKVVVVDTPLESFFSIPEIKDSVKNIKMTFLLVEN